MSFSINGTPPRKRETDLRTSTLVQGTWGNGAGGSGTYVRSGGLIGSKKVIEDYNNHNFRALQASGKIIMGDLALSTWSREVTNGSLTCIVPNSGGFWSTNVGDFAGMVENTTAAKNPPNVNDMSGMANASLIKAIAKMNSAPLLSGEILNDLDRTIGNFKKPFGSARSLLGKTLKRKMKLVKLGRTVAEAASQAWLEYRYGWRPIILDTVEIIEQSQKFRDKFDGVRFVARAGESSVNTSTTTFASLPLKDEPSWLATGTITRTIELRASAGIIYLVNSKSIDSIMGLRPRDAIATAWEMIPYSFVLDWFVNIGDWLEAVTPNPDVTVQGSWVTTVTDSTTTTVVQNVSKSYDIPPYPLYVASGNGGSSITKSCSVVRDTNPPTLPAPALTASSLSVLHSVDAAALSCKSVLDLLSKLAPRRTR